MSNESLILENDGEGVATLILNRPEKLNAIDDEIRMRLPDLIKEVRQDDGIKVLILTGAGRGFCSGADVAGQAARIAGAAIEKTRQQTLEPVACFLLPLARLEKPTIAAVNGVAAGVGLSLALVCDIRIASEQARFIPVWVNRGLIPDGGATYYLPKLIGLSKALEFMYTGDSISADEAGKIGLVSEVVPHDGLIPKAREIATRLAKGPSVAIELIKKAVYRKIHDELESQLYFESYAQTICRQTEDHKESVSAFLEKRAPVFKGL
jgi:2-(1,2-epoxy-1,2-dihydrophenyl)acetyl-CoA isomerase